MKKYYKFPNKKLNNKDVENIFDAAIAAYIQDIALNRHITINIEDMGYKNRPQEFLKKLFDHYRQFARRENFTSAYCWVLENTVHIHVHILLHFPTGHNFNLFKKRFRESWFKDYEISERGYGSEVKYKSLNYGYFNNKKELATRLNKIKSEIISKEHHLDYINTAPEGKYGYGQFHDIANLCNYLSKGIAFNAEGQILGTRCGVSRSLSQHDLNPVSALSA